MRKILLILIGFLALSGVLLVLAPWLGTGAGWNKGFSLVHIWGGLFFLVIFPLYSWDHVSAHRNWLRFLTGVTLSGVTQLVSGGLLLLTGLVLLLYGQAAWGLLRQLHHWLTYLVLASIAFHYLSPKRLPISKGGAERG